MGLIPDVPKAERCCRTCGRIADCDGCVRKHGTVDMWYESATAFRLRVETIIAEKDAEIAKLRQERAAESSDYTAPWSEITGPSGE